MTAGMRESATARCRRRSRPLIPVIRRSSTRQPVFSRWAELKNSSAEANVSTPKPTDRRRFRRDRRSDSSSSTMETTGLSRSPMRPSLSLVSGGVESICYLARWSSGTRLPYLDRVGLLPAGATRSRLLSRADPAVHRFPRPSVRSRSAARRVLPGGNRLPHPGGAGWPTPSRGNSEARGAPDQIGQRPGLHLLHHVPTLFLDGGFAGSQLPGGLLVQQTGDGGAHHVPLARGQQVIPATKLGELQPLRARHAITIDRLADGIEEVLLAKRLREKLDRAGFPGPDRHGDITVPGEKDDRQRRVRVGEFLLKVEAAQPRQADVEHEAPW